MFIKEIKRLSPTKILSLVPSITELLHYLQLETETIGITKFCVHPNVWFKTKKHIGGTKNIDIEKVKLLQPTLIICSKEENVQAQVDELALLFPVLMTDVKNYEDALNMIKDIGIITAKDILANNLIIEIKRSFSNNILKTNKALYLIWQNPYMTIGGDTFISAMMKMAGFENIYNNKKRYPIIDLETIVQLNPPIILLSSEPYPFKEKHIKTLQTVLPKSYILLVDGEMFSWYGNRMLYAMPYFNQLVKQINKG